MRMAMPTMSRTPMTATPTRTVVDTRVLRTRMTGLGYTPHVHRPPLMTHLSQWAPHVPRVAMLVVEHSEITRILRISVSILVLCTLN